MTEQMQTMTFAPTPLQNWVDNAHVATQGYDATKITDSSLFIPVTSPATGEVIGYCPKSTGKDVNFAVASSVKAYESWR